MLLAPDQLRELRSTAHATRITALSDARHGNETLRGLVARIRHGEHPLRTIRTQHLLYALGLTTQQAEMVMSRLVRESKTADPKSVERLLFFAHGNVRVDRVAMLEAAIDAVCHRTVVTPHWSTWPYPPVRPIEPTTSVPVSLAHLESGPLPAPMTTAARAL